MHFLALLLAANIGIGASAKAIRLKRAAGTIAIDVWEHPGCQGQVHHTGTKYSPASYTCDDGPEGDNWLYASVKVLNRSNCTLTFYTNKGEGPCQGPYPAPVPANGSCVTLNRAEVVGWGTHCP